MHNLRALVERVMAETEGSNEAILDKVITLVEVTPEVRAEIEETLVKRAIVGVINSIRFQQRNQAWRCGREETRPGDALSRGIVAQHSMSILDYPLSDGQPLRSANRAALKRDWNFYRERARTDAIKQHWFHQMYTAMPDETVSVGEALGEFRVLEFKNLATRRAVGARPAAKQIEVTHGPE